MRGMAKVHKPNSGPSHIKDASRGQAKTLKRKPLPPQHPPQRGGVEMVDPRVQAQLKVYDEALSLFHQQKFAKSKQELEKVLEGPSKELADRARMHLKIAEQRMKPSQEQNPRTADEHYQRGVAMMNIGRWDDARESLDKARKAAPKADYIHYARAARLPSGRSRFRHEKLEGCHRAPAGKPLSRAQRRRLRLSPGRSSFHRDALPGEGGYRQLKWAWV